MVVIYKGHNSVNTVDGVMVLNLGTSSVCTQLQESTSKGFGVIERMRFVY